MGNILDGLNPVNKIGTIQTDFKKSLNTIPTQGFKIAANAKSNFNNQNNGSEPIPLGTGNTMFDKLADEIILQDKSGYEINSLFGESGWVPYGTSYNEAAASVGAVSNKKFLWAWGQTLVNTLDVVVTGGTGSTTIRMGKAVMTVNKAKSAVLGTRILFGAANYHYNYYLDWTDSFVKSAGSNINLATAYRVTSLLPKNKVTSYIANTSHDYLHYIEKKNIFGAKKDFTLANFGAYTLDGNITNFSGKIPKGSKWSKNAISITIQPDAFYNRGLYELNKEIGPTPYNIFNHKVGISEKQYKANKEALDRAVESVPGANLPSSEDTYEKIYGKEFMDITNTFGQLAQASDANSASDIFWETAEKNKKSGLNVAGRFMKSMPNTINYFENQRLNNQYSIIQINELQKTLSDADWTLGLYQAPKTLGAITVLNAENAILKLGSYAVNGAQQIIEPIATIGNSLFVRSQQIVNNTANAVANLFGMGVSAKAKAAKEANPVKTSKQESAKVSHTLVIKPITYPTPGSDMISLDKKYIQKNIPILSDKEWEIKQATEYLSNKKAQILKQLEEEKKNYTPSFLTGSTKKGTPKKDDMQRIAGLQQQYISITNYIDKVQQSIKTGVLKYDYKTNTFNNQKIW
jgi:hypothetical protein